MVGALGLFASVLFALGGDCIGKGASGFAQRFGCTPFAAIEGMP